MRISHLSAKSLYPNAFSYICINSSRYSSVDSYKALAVLKIIRKPNILQHPKVLLGKKLGKVSNELVGFNSDLSCDPSRYTKWVNNQKENSRALIAWKRCEKIRWLKIFVRVHYPTKFIRPNNTMCHTADNTMVSDRFGFFPFISRIKIVWKHKLILYSNGILMMLSSNYEIRSKFIDAKMDSVLNTAS